MGPGRFGSRGWHRHHSATHKWGRQPPRAWHLERHPNPGPRDWVTPGTSSWSGARAQRSSQLSPCPSCSMEEMNGLMKKKWRLKWNFKIKWKANLRRNCILESWGQCLRDPWIGTLGPWFCGGWSLSRVGLWSRQLGLDFERRPKRLGPLTFAWGCPVTLPLWGPGGQNCPLWPWWLMITTANS